jgi:hypothetical protein
MASWVLRMFSIRNLKCVIFKFWKTVGTRYWPKVSATIIRGVCENDASRRSYIVVLFSFSNNVSISFIIRSADLMSMIQLNL